nr:MAG TPA: hypothetical protein [Caudoviricetes sp.]
MVCVMWLLGMTILMICYLTLMTSRSICIA